MADGFRKSGAGQLRKGKAKRRIPPSGEGRLRFQQGDPHALDVQLDEARNVNEQLGAIAAHLPELLATLEQFQQTPSRLAEEDEALATFLGEHYSDRKHVDHIRTTLMIFRRKRALARLQAAESALRLAEALLAPDPLIPHLIELIQAGPGPVARAEIDREQFTGSPRRLHEQLTQVKNRLREIQATLGQGNGWIDIQYVRRERVRPIVVLYILALNKQREDGTPIPVELEREIDPELATFIKARKEIPERLAPLVYEMISYGPYPFFRWREGEGPVYAVSLADKSVEMPERFKMGGFFAIRRRKKHT